MTRRLAALLVLGAFGPYLAFGVRTEQLAIYLVTLATVLLGLRKGVRYNPGVAVLALLWGSILAVSIISGLAPPWQAENVSPFAGVDALLAPLCLMVLMMIWTGGTAQADVALTIQKTTVVLLAANAALAVSMSLVDLTPLLARHWWTGAEGTAVGELAAINGRYGGVFNTPLAAGTAYGVGLIVLAYLYTSRVWVGPRVGLLFAALMVGGLMPQSKAFMLAGVPLAVIVLIAASRRRRGSTVLALAAVTVLTYMALSRTVWYQKFGGARITQLLSGSDDPLALYTAGRYGQGTDVGGIWEQVMQTAPWGGYGTGVALGALDTSWVEMVARAGLLGLGLFIAWLVVAAFLTGWRRREKSLPQMWASRAMVVMTVAAAAGGPSLTQNRAGTILLLNLLALLATTTVVVTRHDEDSARVATPPSAGLRSTTQP